MALLRAEAVNEALQPHAEELLSSGQLDDTILDQLVQAVRSLEQTPLLRAGNLLMVYLGLLYSVVEAWRKWRFTDARVDAMLKSPYVSELGDFRDAVFHVVPATDARLLAWEAAPTRVQDRKSTRLNSSHGYISYAVFCLKKKKKVRIQARCSRC